MKISRWYRPTQKSNAVYITYAHLSLPTLRIPTGLMCSNPPTPTEEVMIAQKEAEVEDAVRKFHIASGFKDFPTPNTLHNLMHTKSTSSLLTDHYRAWVKNHPFLIYKGIHTTIAKDVDKVIPQMVFQDTTKANFTRLRDYWVKQGHNNTTTVKRLDTFANFLNAMEELGEHKPNPDYLRFVHGLKCTPHKANIFVLTKDEFDILLNFKFPNPHRQYAVNRYLLSCATGLRVTDCLTATKDDVKFVDGCLRVMVPVKKNKGQLSRVPLNEWSKEILYNRDLSFTTVQQQVREDLWDALEEARPLMPPSYCEFKQYWKMVGNTPAHIVDEKWKFLVFHTSRKFFASYFTSVIKSDVVKTWGGWTDTRSFERYKQDDFGEAKIIKEFGLGK